MKFSKDTRDRLEGMEVGDTLVFKSVDELLEVRPHGGFSRYMKHLCGKKLRVTEDILDKFLGGYYIYDYALSSDKY